MEFNPDMDRINLEYFKSIQKHSFWTKEQVQEIKYQIKQLESKILTKQPQQLRLEI